MGRWFLDLNVADGIIPQAVWFATAVTAVILLVRDRTRAWALTVLPAVAVGAALGVAAVAVVDATDALGVPMPAGSAWWMAVAGGGLGLGVASFWRTRPWRKVLAGLVIVLAPLSAAMGINGGFGLTPTIADVFGVDTLPAAGALPAKDAVPSVTASPSTLYRTWKPPKDMPKTGKVAALSGADRIPSTGGFAPRDASLYLPPAALVKNPPRLPFVVMMNGRPGSPTPHFVEGALNALAAAHRGLAPIVIVADQLGAQLNQPACSADSVYGDVPRYINVDIPRYARTHLNITDKPSAWTIAGYSDGGACALKWAAQHPDLWGNLIDISGDLYPGASSPAATLKDGFRGNRAAEAAQRPTAFLARNAGRYGGHVAVFTGGALDPRFSGYGMRNASLLHKAGFTASFLQIPGATHVGPALSGGLTEAFTRLYPVLGLAAAQQ